MSVVLTPESTRRYDVPARQIRLADGNCWGFVTPTVRLTPRVDSQIDVLGRKTEKVVVELQFGYGPKVQELLDRMREYLNADSRLCQYEAFFSLAVALLRQRTRHQLFVCLRVAFRARSRFVAISSRNRGDCFRGEIVRRGRSCWRSSNVSHNDLRQSKSGRHEKRTRMTRVSSISSTGNKVGRETDEEASSKREDSNQFAAA